MSLIIGETSLPPTSYQEPQINYITHPAATPPTDQNICPFLTLDPSTIAQILWLANNHNTLGVCRKFALAEDMFMSTMGPSTLQTRRKLRQTQASYLVPYIEKLLLIFSESVRHEFQSAHDIFLSSTEKTILESIYLDVCGEYPLTLALIKAGLLPNNVPLDQLKTEAETWLQENKDSCTRLTFYYPNFLPSELTTMPRLRTLRIFHAQFTTLPEWLFEIPLTELTIRESPSTLLSPKIAHIKSLEIISFQECKISSLPEELTSLTNLRIADFCKNPFKGVSDEFKAWAESGILRVDSDPPEADYKHKDLLCCSYHRTYGTPLFAQSSKISNSVRDSFSLHSGINPPPYGTPLFAQSSEISNSVQDGYSLHPATKPPDDSSKIPFFTLQNKTIAEILLRANNPHAREVCRRFARIEDLHTYEKVTGFTKLTPLQMRRIYISLKIKHIKRQLKRLPESVRKSFTASPHDIFLSPKMKTQLENILSGKVFAELENLSFFGIFSSFVKKLYESVSS